MFNRLIFSTDGQWENTTLLVNGENVPFRAINVELVNAEENRGDGGIDEGGDLTGLFTYVAPGDDANDLNAPTEEATIFPGSFAWNGVGRQFRVELMDVTNDFRSTRVFVDDIEITNDIVDFNFEIDMVADSVTAWYRYVSARHWGKSTIEQVVLVG